MSGILYGVGVGPGDPDMMTLQAVKTIERADLVAVPRSDAGRSVAHDIAQRFLEGKEIVELYMPMTMDRKKLAEAHDAAAQTVCDLLREDKSVAFLTLGDVSLYSTFYYLQERVEALGYCVELIPGVPALCATAARLKRPIAAARQSVKIIPALKQGGADEVLSSLSQGDSVIVMKSGSALAELKRGLAAKGEAVESAGLVVNCSMKDEEVYLGIADAPDDAGYFSTILVKPKL